MAKKATTEASGPDTSLRRLGGGRWQTRDERFTIEPQSGTWVIVDADQTDDLGLPLVRGPFRSLTDAKAAIEEARGSDVIRSPLEERIEEARRRPSTDREPGDRRGARAPARRSKPPATEPEAERPAPPPPEIPEGLEIETVWVVEAPFARDAAKRRPAVRHEHLERVGRLMAEGRLIEAGGYTDFSGAILMVRAASADEALELIRDDVYLRAGVWREPLRAREYNRVVRSGGESPGDRPKRPRKR
jgi:uncharacterized protein YciI